MNTLFISIIENGVKCEVLREFYNLFVLFSRKAEPFCAKYHQYSRVDVRTRESSVDNFVSGRMENHVDNESDNEDDPTKLLDQWLGELNTLKKVNKKIKTITW